MKRKGVGTDVDREWELRLGCTRATWRSCRNPGAPPGRWIQQEETAPTTLYCAHERRGHEPPGGLGTQGGRTRGAEWWWQPPKRAERARDKAGINKEGENGGGTEAPAEIYVLPGGGSIRSR